MRHGRRDGLRETGGVRETGRGTALTLCFTPPSTPYSPYPLATRWPGSCFLVYLGSLVIFLPNLFTLANPLSLTFTFFLAGHLSSVHPPPAPKSVPQPSLQPTLPLYPITLPGSDLAPPLLPSATTRSAPPSAPQYIESDNLGSIAVMRKNGLALTGVTMTDWPQEKGGGQRETGRYERVLVA